MIQFPSTLVGRLILSFIGAVLVSTALVIWFLIVAVEGRLEEHEELTIVANIASVHRKLLDLPADKWNETLELVETAEWFYWLSPEPAAVGPLVKPLYVRLFANHLGGTEIGYYEEIGPVGSVWDEFGTDDEDTCFREVARGDYSEPCPHRVFSLKVGNGLWLNASTDQDPGVLILLIPVSLSAALALIFVLLATVIVVRRITLPLRELSDHAEKLGRGEHVEELPVTGPRELRSLTASFNTMQERLIRYVRGRTSMLGAISHDLRTPITSLRIRAEFVENESLRDKMITIVEDLEKMVDSTLDFARLEGADDSVESIDLVETIAELSEEVPGVLFSCAVESCIYSCHAVGLRRAIRNLIDNAVTYGACADVTLSEDAGKVCIGIRDKGPGIPEEQFEAVFEPFCRLDPARNVEHGSVGLGLAIARTIIHKHGGSITLANGAEGLDVVVLLPR